MYTWLERLKLLLSKSWYNFEAQYFSYLKDQPQDPEEERKRSAGAWKAIKADVRKFNKSMSQLAYADDFDIIVLKNPVKYCATSEQHK